MQKIIQNNNQTDYTNVFQDLIDELGDVFKWQWDDKRQALLVEFARDKKDLCFPVLQQYFTDEWNKKSIKKAPKALKSQLGDLIKLSKEQRLFTSPEFNNKPAVMGVWWPWGHGGTYSLRLVVLTQNYYYPEDNNKGWWLSFKERFELDYL